MIIQRRKTRIETWKAISSILLSSTKDMASVQVSSDIACRSVHNAAGGGGRGDGVKTGVGGGLYKNEQSLCVNANSRQTLHTLIDHVRLTVWRIIELDIQLPIIRSFRGGRTALPPSCSAPHVGPTYTVKLVRVPEVNRSQKYLSLSLVGLQ